MTSPTLELPPPDILVREDFGLGDSTVHTGYSVEETKRIALEVRRQALEEAARAIELHVIPQDAEPYANGIRAIAIAIRALK